MPPGELVTLPRPFPFSTTVRPFFCSEKVAVTAFAPLRTNVHTPAPAHPAPDQPVKTDPTAGVAVSVIGVPLANCPEHEAPQLIPPGDELTVPEPEPVFVTVTPRQLAPVVAETLPEPPFELVKLAAFV